jgi:signal transduction histidine kinase
MKQQPWEVPERVTSRPELERDGAGSRLTRERAVIRKRLLGPGADRRLRREVATLERLRGLAGVAQLLEAHDDPPTIVMADAGPRTAAALAKPLEVEELLRLAVALARAVAGMHARGIMHRDLHPDAIVISEAGDPTVVSFALATSLAEVRPEFAHHAELRAALAYVAPEQTGRTARPVDERADLYALGATLFELATGEPPFGTEDPLRLTHDHLARAPEPPAARNPAIPDTLSHIILRLLEKEPDRRYQSATGLLHDLERVRDDGLRIGRHDVPRQLRPPSRLAGREREVATLEQAFAEALNGRCQGVLVAGATGVGKTALVDELRPVVAKAGGWFVAGKFDAYRGDLEFDGIHHALRALGRLLLAEPDAELAAVRSRILAAAGANASLLAATVPELAALLRVAPQAGDPLTAQGRAQRAALAVLRAVASPERPLVVFADDLHWAGPTPLGAVELALTERATPGLLLVAAYRPDGLDAAHPVTRAHAGVRRIALGNLPRPALAAMLADMLRADPVRAGELATAIEPHTGGNPYETVELLDALRRAGLLWATPEGWRWEPLVVQEHLGHPEGRVDALPPAAVDMLEAMACLGGRVEIDLLAAATGQPPARVEQWLAPALDSGTLLLEPGREPAVRFDHDRGRDALLERLDARARGARRLGLARQLARRPERFAAAAEQYLAVTQEIAGDEERASVVALLRRAAHEATLIGDHARVEALLSAALRLLDPADAAAEVEVRTGRQAALFGLGRLAEADEEFHAIARLRPAAADRAQATVVQIRALSHRLRFTEAIDLGLEALRACGVTRPAELPEHPFEPLRAWLETTGDVTRPPLDDPDMLTAGRVIDAVLPVAYFVPDPQLIAWLGLQALEIWTRHGPSPALVGPISHAAYYAGLQTGDLTLAYRGLRRIVELGETHGFEPATSQARHMFAAVSCWFEPIERGVEAAHRARQGLIAGADPAYAGYTYQLAVPYLADCAPTLEDLAAEVRDGVEFLRQTGDEQTAQWLDGYAWLARRLRGETTDELAVDRYADNPLPLLYGHLNRALAAAVLGDAAALAQHTAAITPLLAGAAGSYATAVGKLLRALAIAEQLRTTDGSDEAELDELTDWFARRADDAPENFLHVLRLLEAERAWAAGDFQTALLAFDAARREGAVRRRPWHRALIAEHAARFYLAHGLEQAGHELLESAREAYREWGATAKLAQLDWAYPALGADGAASRAVTTGTIDLLGLLSASQALSSETGIERLHARLVDVLGAMTGATHVHLLLVGEGGENWLQPAPGGGLVAVAEDAAPMSVLRYAQRSGEPLVVADALRDDRFARDPFLLSVSACSLLAVPVLNRGVLRAVLVLENRLIRGAFSAERLEAVKLISGQLAVSLDNVGLYTELTRSRARIVAAADEARRRIARDLHDGSQQRLVQTIIALKAARGALEDDAEATAALLEGALARAEEAMAELRELSHGILPSALTHGGLRAAVRALSSRLDVPVDMDIASERVASEIEASAYFIVAEALTNVVKHAQASRIAVRAAIEDGALIVEVRDDGVGGADPAGHGLVGVADRVHALGGRLRLHSPAGAGTSLTVSIPLAG